MAASSGEQHSVQLACPAMVLPNNLLWEFAHHHEAEVFAANGLVMADALPLGTLEHPASRYCREYV